MGLKELAGKIMEVSKMLNLDREFQKLCKILEKAQEIVPFREYHCDNFDFREIKTICEYFYEQEISEKRIKTCLKKYKQDGSFIPTPTTPKALCEVFEIMLAVKNSGFESSDIPCEYRRKWRSLPELLKEDAKGKDLGFYLARCCRFLCEALSRDSDEPGFNVVSPETARYNVTVVYWFKHLLDKFLKIPYIYPVFKYVEFLEQIIPVAQQNNVRQVYTNFLRVWDIIYNLLNPIEKNQFYQLEILHKKWMHDPNTKQAFEESWKNSKIYQILSPNGEYGDDLEKCAALDLLEIAYIGNYLDDFYFAKKFDNVTADLLKSKELNIIDVLAGINYGLLKHSEWLSAEQGYSGKRKKVEQDRKNKENQDV